MKQIIELLKAIYQALGEKLSNVISSPTATDNNIYGVKASTKEWIKVAEMDSIGNARITNSNDTSGSTTLNSGMFLNYLKPLTGDLNITLSLVINGVNGGTYLGQWMIQFITGDTVPNVNIKMKDGSNIIWAEEFVVNLNCTYQVSITNNVALYVEIPNS